MITKAIVEEIISPYQARVRIPVLDRVESDGLFVPKDELSIATICTLPNCYLNVQVGDIVFVGFEDNAERKVVILGHLSREATLDSAVDLTVNNLNIRTSLTAPESSTIGDITYSEIQALSGIKDNIQKQLDLIQEQIQDLQSRST